MSWDNQPKPGWHPPAAQPWPVTNKLQAPVTPASTLANRYDSFSQDQVLMAWDNMKKKITELREEEMEMRKYIVSRAFPEAKEGMNTADLGEGYQLKAGVKFNYNLDPDVKKVEEALDKIEALGNEGSFIADRLVAWKPNFLLTEYRKLCEPDATEAQKKIREIIETVLTITDGTPTLEIKEPKKAK
jgi:hypothetical protein